MTLIIRLIKIVLFILAMALGAWFASENGQFVPLMLFGFALPPLKLGVALLLALAVGLGVGLLVSLWPYFTLKQRMLLQGRKLKNCEKELASLRAGALRD